MSIKGVFTLTQTHGWHAHQALVDDTDLSWNLYDFQKPHFLLPAALLFQLCGLMWHDCKNSWHIWERSRTKPHSTIIEAIIPTVWNIWCKTSLNSAEKFLPSAAETLMSDCCEQSKHPTGKYFLSSKCLTEQAIKIHMVIISVNLPLD